MLIFLKPRQLDLFLLYNFKQYFTLHALDWELYFCDVIFFFCIIKFVNASSPKSYAYKV